jgi:hypothetical protein
VIRKLPPKLKDEKQEPPNQEQFYQRVDAGEPPYGKGMGLKQGQAYRWMKNRPIPTKVQVTVTPPRPTAAQPTAEQISKEPGAAQIQSYLTKEECVDLYSFVWGQEGLIADGILEVPEAGRSRQRCEAQGERLYNMAVRHGWDREDLMKFMGDIIFGVGVMQDSWFIYKAWNEKEKIKKPKKPTEQQPSVVQGAPGAAAPEFASVASLADSKLRIAKPATGMGLGI